LRQQKIRKQRAKRHLRILSRLEPVEAEGIEAVAASPILAANQANQEAGGAKSGAADPQLQQVIEAWPRLRRRQRAAVLAIVRASACATKPTGRAVGASAGKGGRNPSRAAKPLSAGGFRQSAAQQHVARAACSGSAGIGRVGHKITKARRTDSSMPGARSKQACTAGSQSDVELRASQCRRPNSLAAAAAEEEGASGNQELAGAHSRALQQEKTAPVTALGGASRKRRVPNSNEGAGGK
jgi:hypothetical protein